MAGDAGKVARPAAKKAAAAPVPTPEPADVAPVAPSPAADVQTPIVDDSTVYVVSVEDADNVEVSVPNDVDEAEVGDYLVLALEEKGIDKSKLVSYSKASDIDPAPGAVTPGAGDGNVPEVPDSVDTDTGLDLEALARLAAGDPDTEVVVEEPVEVAPFLSGREHVFSKDGDRYLVLGAIFSCWVDGNYRAADKGDVVVVAPEIAEKSLRKGYLLALDDES